MVLRLLVLLLISALVIFIISKTGIISFPNNDSSRMQQYENTSYSVLTFQPPQSTPSRSFPIVQDKTLVLLPISDDIKTPVKTSLEVMSGGRSIYQGGDDPTPSPDLHTTAFINTDGSLGLINAEGLNKLNLPNNLFVDYISGWSPDSKRLIVHSTSNDLSKTYNGYGGPPTSMEFPMNRLPGGFYLVDVVNGKVTFLYPLSGFVDWIDSNKVLAVVQLSYEPREQYIIFDTNNFLADYETLKDKFSKFEFAWFSFDDSGKKWAISLGNTGNDQTKPSYSDIILADFPAITGQTVDQGGWADVQLPNLSPSGKLLVYANSGNLVIWDGTNKTRVEDARFIMWINDNQFIYSKTFGQATNQQTKYYLYEVGTAESAPLN